MQGTAAHAGSSERFRRTYHCVSLFRRSGWDDGRWWSDIDSVGQSVLCKQISHPCGEATRARALTKHELNQIEDPVERLRLDVLAKIRLSAVTGKVSREPTAVLGSRVILGTFERILQRPARAELRRQQERVEKVALTGVVRPEQHRQRLEPHLDVGPTT